MDLSTGTLSKTNFALDFYKPWMNLLNHNQYVASTTSIDDDGFKITMNVQQFNPEEITVKVVDGWVVVEARHEKHDETNVATQQFVKRYLLPNRVDINQVTSLTSSDGILTITAPLKLVEEKMIQIEVDAGQTAAGQVGAGQASARHARYVSAGQTAAGAGHASARRTDAGKAGAYYTV